MKKILERLNCGPVTGEKVYIAPSASVLGEVIMGDNVSVWHGTVIRGDVNRITIDKNSNIQDNSVLHVTSEKEVNIGRGVTVGHAVKLHGCFIGNNVLVGIGAIVLDGVKINDNCVIAAGSLIPPGKEIPEGSMVMGAPAKAVRRLTEKEMIWIRQNALHYIEYKEIYRSLSPQFKVPR